ncbi:MAG: hypothetical protein QG657_883 [Acidobacteriota bacterium]|nr:hypothetical protein [Acidobacteriota bacterium]
MNCEQESYDLVVLVADRNMENSINGILERPEAIRIKQIKSEIYIHPHRDPGCLNKGHDFLRPFVNRCRHALVIFDKEGCGKEKLTREALEIQMEDNLKLSGWGERAAAVVIDPELENWLWSDSPEVDLALGWKGRTPPLRRWLEEKGFLTGNSVKPSHPKEAVESALRTAYQPKSSSIYHRIAKSVSLKRCQDPAFLKLKDKLYQWFGL